MPIAIFTDEINREDPLRALQLAAQWGVGHVEVRTLPGGRYPQPSDGELTDFYHMVRDQGLVVSGVSPGFCKGDWEDESVAEVLAEGLPRACQWARRWGTDLVSCFGFKRGDGDQVPAAVVDLLGRMADIAAAHGCRLVLENQAVCWGNTGLEAAAIIAQVGADKLRLCWDPGNSARAGSASPFPDEYQQLKGLIEHVHLKNFDPAAGKWSLMETGTVDWPGQLAALAADGYSGYLVVETHLSISPDAFEPIDSDLQGLEANTWRNLQYLRRLLDRG